jgi:hypothetical protein
VSSCGPAPRRPAGGIAAVVVLALAVAVAGGSPMAVPVAIPVASAQGPAGGYHPPDSAAGKSAGGGLEEVWSAVRAPLRWLRKSSRSFQGLMRKLAERSAQVAGNDDDRPFPPAVKRPRRAPVEKEPPRQSVYGGEAGAGRD